MARFLFRFGYCTPAQMDANQGNGWDDEQAAACFIVATTRETALVFGCEVAEQMVNHLFAAAGHAPVSWQDDGFAFWIEDDPAEILELELSEAVPVVMAGEIPDFSRWNLRTG